MKRRAPIVQRFGRQANQRCRYPEKDCADDQRDASSISIADCTGEHAAACHSKEASGDNRRKIAARHAPFADEGGNSKPDQLAVEPIEHNGERREKHDTLLKARPQTLVQHLSDIKPLRRVRHTFLPLVLLFSSYETPSVLVEQNAFECDGCDRQQRFMHRLVRELAGLEKPSLGGRRPPQLRPSKV